LDSLPLIQEAFALRKEKPMSENPLHVLLVEDNPGDVRLFKEYLKKSPHPDDFQLDCDASINDCLKRLDRHPMDLILLDLTLPDGAGLDTLKQVHDKKPEIPIIILTGNQDKALAIESLKKGAQDYLNKNQMDGDLLIRSIRYSVERFQLFKKIEEERQRYELVATGSNDGIWDWDLVANQIYYSPRWKMILGYEEDEITATPEEWLKRVHREDILQMSGDLAEHLARKTPHFANEHRLKHKDGSYRWVLSRGIAVFNSQNKPIRMAGSFTDITLHKQLEESLEQQAYYDPLTQIPNRLLFRENLKRAFAHSQRNPQYLFAVLFLDVDRFKYVNDRFGHETGDQLLVEFALRLQTCLRPSDFLARVGGDEFNVLLDNLTDPSEAVSIAERILESLEKPFTLSGTETFISSSIGIVYSNWDCATIDNLVKAADQAMYRAKQAGKGRYEIYQHSDPGMNPAAEL
jgi:diguanylate cyclase (GGDEF)-like protein/PAS domain S-box-containing protein